MVLDGRLMMKTPTLIVRLIGIYLGLKAAGGLMALWQVRRTYGELFPEGANFPRQATELSLFPLAGMLVVGFLMARYAGWLARLLTADSEPR